MKRFCLGFAALMAFPTLSRADGAGAAMAQSDCGGEAYSFAEVGSVPRSGEPLIAVPGTLCADVRRRETGIGSLNIYIDPNRNAGSQPVPGGDFPMRTPPRRRH